VKKIKKLLVPSTGGFTLIELMIVIVIIGLLSGILIALINPTKTQNRARDATVKAAINKIALAASAYVSATGSIATGIDLPGELTSNVIVGTTATNTALFTINGNPLPVGGTAGCSANSWSGAGATQCSYFYCGGDDGTSSALPAAANCTAAAGTQNYKIMAKSYAAPDSTFMFRSSDSRLYLCNASTCALAN
jgi:prepilin-type N-terminal cleavage/methylation domain-containing protein